jgi:hypothetical protein
MSGQTSTALLNDLLNRLSRSWLQYIGEAWPWTSSEDAERLEKFQGLVRRQNFAAERIADLLTDRNAVFSQCSYPFDGSQVNYVTLDFVKPRIIVDEQTILAALKATGEALQGDAEVLRLIEQVTADEEQTLSELAAL